MNSAQHSLAGSPFSRIRARVGVRGWLRRITLLGWAAGTVWLVWDQAGGRALLQFDLLSAQRECMSFEDAPERLVYDGDSKRVDTHVHEGGYEPIRRSHRSGSAGFGPMDASESSTRLAAVSTDARQTLARYEAAREAILKWQQLKQFAAAGRVLTNVPRSGLVQRGLHLIFREWRPIYCHSFRATGGRDRLVIIQIRVDDDGVVGFDSEVFAAATLFSDASSSGLQSATVASRYGALDLVLDDHREGSTVTVFRSVADPADASRLTIDYEMDGGRGTIEGKLQPNDTVNWTVLSGPAMTH